MFYLHCTKNIQKLFAIKNLNDVPTEEESPLGFWYVNIICIDSRDVLIFMNQKTLLSLLVVPSSRHDWTAQTLTYDFGQNLFKLLLRENISQENIEKLLIDQRNLLFCKTNSRVLLGLMNELSGMYVMSVEDDGGFANCDLSQIIDNINRIDKTQLGWKKPIDALNESLA